MKADKRFRTDATQTKSLVAAGKNAAANALRASKALSLEITFIKDGVIFQESPDGTQRRLAPVVSKNQHVSSQENSSRRVEGSAHHRVNDTSATKATALTKGTILRAK